MLLTTWQLWLVTFALKLLTSVTLLGFASEHVVRTASEIPVDDVGAKSLLEGIARYTLHGKRIM